MLAYHSMPTQSDLSATQSVLQYLTAVHVSAGILTRLVCHAHSWHEIVPALLFRQMMLCLCSCHLWLHVPVLQPLMEGA